MRDKAKREVKSNHNFTPRCLPQAGNLLYASMKTLCECTSTYCRTLGWTGGRYGGVISGVKGPDPQTWGLLPHPCLLTCRKSPST